MDESIEKPSKKRSFEKKDYPICADCKKREMFTSVCSTKHVKVFRGQSACKDEFDDKRPKRF